MRHVVDGRLSSAPADDVPERDVAEHSSYVEVAVREVMEAQVDVLLCSLAV